MNPEERFEELINALKEREYRLTPQRVELVRLIPSSEGHPSAAQLYSAIKSRFPTMSQATVYKTLTLLKEMNQVDHMMRRLGSQQGGREAVGDQARSGASASSGQALRRKANGKQKEYEERTKASKKAEMDAKKEALRAEDISKGVFVPVSYLPKNEPVKAERRG